MSAEGYLGFDDGTPIMTQSDVNLHGKVDLGQRVTDYAVHENNQKEGMPGAIYGPAQYDKVPTNIKEPFGQLNNKNVFYFRALYPGDILSDRHEIFIQRPGSQVGANFQSGSDFQRWRMVKVSDLPSVIKDHKFLSEVGIYGRVDSTGEVKRYFLRDGVMDSETVTRHPFTGQLIQPGEVIACGGLPKGWNIPRNVDGTIKEDALLKMVEGGMREAVKKDMAASQAILDQARADLEAAAEKLAEREQPGTLFTTRKNADAAKFYKVRDLDMVVDYNDPETAARYRRGECRDPDGAAGNNRYYFKLGKIVIGGVPEDPSKVLAASPFNQAQHDEIAARSPDGRGMTALHSREEHEATFTKEEIARGYRFWNQKYKYAYYFSPNSEFVVDDETGKFRPSKIGDNCVAYDPFTRYVFYKHNHGTISMGSERNRNFSPPYLCKKSMFYIHNPHIISYMLQYAGGMMNLEAQNPGDCAFYNDAREIAKYIETVDIGSGALEPDGTPVYKAAFAKARIYGDLQSTASRFGHMVGGSTLAAAASAAAIGAVTQYSSTALGVTAVAALGGLTIPAVVATGLAAVATFSLMSGYLAKDRKFQFTKYEQDFRTDLYMGALKDQGITGLVDIQDEVVGFARALCGLVYMKMHNHNVNQRVEVAGYAATAIAGALAVSAVVAFTMGAAIPLMTSLAAASALGVTGGVGIGLAKMGDIGERHFKHIYFYETAKMPDTDGVFKGRPNDQYTRIQPSDHKKRNAAINAHAEQFKDDIKLPSERPKPEKKKNLAALRQHAHDKNLVQAKTTTVA